MKLLNLFQKEKKGAPPVSLKQFPTKQNQEKINKSYIPHYLYKPPFGYPRYINLPYIRQLASSPFVDMCISTIIEEFMALEWNVVPYDDEEDSDKYKKDIENAEYFLEHPNDQGGFEHLMRKYLRDILEIDSGVINKVFDIGQNLVELLPRDGATFTKNPNIHGVYDDRDDYILGAEIADEAERGMPRGIIMPNEARERAAYFQYGWFSGMRPIPFGKKEIIWGEKYPRTDQRYGRSPVQVLAEALQTLIYSIQHNLEYYNNNSIPKGVIGLDGGDSESIKEFKQQWKEQQKTKDKFGNVRQMFHNLPIFNKLPKFEKLEFSNEELQLIEQQKWFSKMVWASFGVTPSELGYVEDSNRATEIIQSRVFKRKAINPLVRMIERQITHEVLPDLGYDHLKFKFSTFDVEEEKNKADLYKGWVENGIRTVNEIRQREGLEEVEWGDKPPKKFQQSSNPFEQMNEQEEKSIEGKPLPKPTGNENKEEFVSRCMGDETMKKEYPDEDQRSAVCYSQFSGKKSESEEEKALGTYDGQSQNPLVLGENEVPDFNRWKKALKYWTRKKRDEIINLLEHGKVQQKGVDDVKDRAEEVLSAEALRDITEKTVKHLFNQNREKLEEKWNMNFMPNQEAIEYLKDYTFSNIKDMTEEAANDLRQELERGFIGGESTSQLKKRVKKVFTDSEDRAEAIARTESNRIENQSELTSLKQSGQEFYKEWVAALDERTSGICSRLHGQKVKLNENFKDNQTGWEGQAPPSHVNCRSTLVYRPTESKENKSEPETETEDKNEISELINESNKLKTKISENQETILNKLKREKEDYIQNKELELAKKKQKLIDKLESELNGN